MNRRRTTRYSLLMGLVRPAIAAVLRVTEVQACSFRPSGSVAWC